MSAQSLRAPAGTSAHKQQVPLSRGHALVFERAQNVPREFWERGFSDDWKDFQYYDLLEETMGRPFKYLYLAVAETSAIQFEILSREYFLEAGRQSPAKFLYFVWCQASRAVAFSFCTIWNGTIYDNDLGLNYSVAYDLNLYYVTFCDLLNWALANGLRRYVSAPFNYDPKLRLRLELQPVDIYVKHISPWLNPLIKLFASHFEPARTDPVLRQRLHLLQ
jgi:hypothetical protein